MKHFNLSAWAVSHPALILFLVIALGAAGFVDEKRSTVMFAPNLAWRDERLRTSLEDLLGLAVVVENDANAAAWAEARFGAGRGEDEVVVLTMRNP